MQKGKMLKYSWMLFVYLLSPIESSSGGCQSRESARPLIKNLGDRIQLRCLDDSPCEGTGYAFYHYHLQTGQFELIYQGSHKLTITIDTLNNAGEYYCSKECSRNASTVDQNRCYWNVIVPPILQWDVSETVAMNGSTNGSCMATGSPLPEIEVITSRHCEHRAKLTVIDNYTATAEFTIPHISRQCKYIYCHIVNHQSPPFSRQLNITENANDRSSQGTNDTTAPETIADDGNVPAGSVAKSVTMKTHVLLIILILALLLLV